MINISHKHFLYKNKTVFDNNDIILIYALYEKKIKEYNYSHELMDFVRITENSSYVNDENSISEKTITKPIWDISNKMLLDKFHTFEYDNNIIKIIYWKIIKYYREYVSESLFFEKFVDFAHMLMGKKYIIEPYTKISKKTRDMYEKSKSTWIYPILYVLSGWKDKLYNFDDVRTNYKDVEYKYNIKINKTCNYNYYNLDEMRIYKKYNYKYDIKFIFQ